MTTQAESATELSRLHTDPDLLVMVNVWDAVSATVVAAAPGCQALATASHSIAASFGYADGEQIPLESMVDMIGRICAAVDVPVSADIEGGYGDVAATVRLAIQAGAVGANLEDQMRPVAEAAAQVERAVAAAQAEGIDDFVLNARTDAFLKAGDRDREDVVADAIARGRAFLDAGAACVFVPGSLDAPTIGRLVDALGPRTLSVIGLPGTPDQATLASLGVARLSFGPITQRLALTSLQDAATVLLAGGTLPEGIRALN